MHKTIHKKVIILGIDAMDPAITEDLMKKGKLPNFSYLKDTGAYAHLSTTIPAESVVAWTSFATGLKPAAHGIFDFIMRDPKTYLPYLSLNEITSVNGKIKIQIRKKGSSFWDVLSKNNIPSFIYFCPNTFPPEALRGKMLSGMGTPDILGNMGRFSFYTTKTLTAEDKNSRGKIIAVNQNNNFINTSIYGPQVAANGASSEASIPLKITLMPQENLISLNLQGNNFSLKQGTWSNWQRVAFKIGTFKKMHGIMRFYLKSITPEFELYASPINFDPLSPFFPISYPHNFSKQIVKKLGFYYTQGMPHDTWALSEGRLDERAFLEQTDDILKDNQRILQEELKNFKGGLFFFYFETLDMVQHMFWRYIDQRHPLYQNDPIYQETISTYYQKIDHLLGEILKNLDKDTTLIVLSDHGFASFRKSVHLNRWLLENGYLVLKNNAQESKEFFENVDWSKTKAYALGFGGIYFNKTGREYYGIVNNAQTANLKQQIIERLKKLTDPETKESVISNVYTQEKAFPGPYENEAPDLFVGFQKGYRASWQTVLGAVPLPLMEENRKKWSGDHLIDPALVPGVIFSNQKLDSKSPSIMDIYPTILSLFNIRDYQNTDGKTLIENEHK